MVCPNCGTENPALARFCISCGKALPRVCPNCGTINPAQARFCMQCGTPLDAGARPALPATPTAASVVSTTSAAGTPDLGATNPAVPSVAPRTTARTTARTGRGTSRRAPAEPLETEVPETEAQTPTTSAARARRSARTASTRAADDAAALDEPEAPAEERRVVTILFADLVSSTQLADHMDPEDLRALLADYFASMAREVRRHGGTVEKYIGDAIMAVFGLPVTHEDDPVRAVRAALGMRAALRRLNHRHHAADPEAPDLRMRMGINTGEVVAASGNEPADGRDFLITGEPVNVAARLQQMAVADTILLGPRTYRAVRGAVRARALPAAEVRGKPRPIRVWEALGMSGEHEVPAPRPRGVDGLRAPLIGRDTEMDLLRVIYARSVSERRPHRITVLGAPGVGKSRLVRDFLNRLLGVSPVAGPDAPADAEVAAQAATYRDAPTVLEGRCPPYGEGITYWPLAEMLRAFCDLSALQTARDARERLRSCVADILSASGRTEDPEVITAYLAQTVGVESAERRRRLLPEDNRQLQEGLFRAWRVFFEALAVKRPLVLVIDDIHWADDALLDLVDYLSTHVADVPLLLICPARPELLEKRPAWGRGPRNDVAIGLEALPTAAAERLVRALLPGAGIPNTLRHGILEKSEGNPFYAEEIVRMLVDRGILVRESPEGANGTHGTSGNDWSVAPEWRDSPEVRDPVIPDTVQGVLAARLDLLAPEERAMLQHASVIGRYFWPSALQVLAPAVPRERLGALLETLERKDLIQEAEHEPGVAPADERTYSFKHALTREVTYGAIPHVRRAGEHARLARWLEGLATDRGEGFLELLAHHYQQYYLQGTAARSRSTLRRQAVRAKAIHYLRLAGDSAACRHAAVKAEHCYSDAIALLEEEPTPETIPLRVELLTSRGDVRWMQTRGDAAWEDYRSALRLWLEAPTLPAPAGPTPVAESAAVAMPAARDASPSDGSRADDTSAAPTAGASGSSSLSFAPPTADEWTRRGLRLYRLLVQLPARNSTWFRDPPSREETRGYLEDGLRLADERGMRDTLEGAALLTAKSFFWWTWPEGRDEADLLDALRTAREAVRITEALGAPRRASEALDALGNMLASTGDLRGQLESHTRRLFWARQIEDTGELVDIHSEVSAAFQMVGEYALAVEHARTALDYAETEDADLLRIQALRREVLAYFEWDRWRDAITGGERLLALAAHTSMAAHSALESTNKHRAVLLTLATIYARTGRGDDAEQVVRLVSDVPIAHEAQLVGVQRARYALAQGAIIEAKNRFLAALEFRTGRPLVATLLAELAELGARTEDRALYERFGEQALELGWRSGARKALAQAIRARGLAATTAGRWDDAVSDLENALDRYHALGTAWEEARTRADIAALARRRGATGDTAVARGQLERALRIFEDLGADSDLAAARADLATLVEGEVQRV